jgi:hypothetical protein
VQFTPPAPGPPAGQKVRSTHSAYFQTSPIAFARPQAVELFRARDLHRRDHTWRHLRFHRSVIKPPTRDDVCELTHTADTPSPMARLPELLGKADRDGAGRSLTITVLPASDPPQRSSRAAFPVLIRKRPRGCRCGGFRLGPSNGPATAGERGAADRVGVALRPTARWSLLFINPDSCRCGRRRVSPHKRHQY